MVFKADFTTHQFDQVTASSQSQPGAFVPARGRIALIKRLEKPRLVLWADSDAGVPYLEAQNKGCAITFFGRGANKHLAFGRKLHGIDQEVREHLPNSARIADQGL